MLSITRWTDAIRHADEADCIRPTAQAYCIRPTAQAHCGGKGVATRTLGLLSGIMAYSIKEGMRTDNQS
jgi:hypothetical protein